VAVTTEATRSRQIAIVFAVFAVAPFVVAAAKSSFWERQHSMAPVATAVYLALVLALVIGRYRWAWIVLVLFYASAELSWLITAHRFSVTNVLGLAVGLATLALLLSRPMRHRVHPPVAVRQRS
jgi:hypothetical protein